MTVVLTVYQQNKLSEEPVEFGATYHRLLQTTEQTYSRDLCLNPGEVKDIDTGWVIAVGLLLFKNLGSHKDDAAFALLRDETLICEEVPKNEVCVLTNPPQGRWKIRNNSSDKTVAIRVVAIPR